MSQSITKPARLGDATPRLLWLDHVRAALTVLVVAHHAAQAYGPTGGAWPVANDGRAPVLGVFIAVNAMYFMSLFFFVSGYFTPATITRKGTRAFLRDRLLRLGAPSMLVLLASGALMERPQFLHLWFVIDLLALNLLYALVWSVRPSRPPSAPSPVPTGASTGGRLLFVALVLAVGTAVARLRYPVDRWVELLGVLPVEPAHAAHYAGAFIAGLVCARTRWIERFSDRLGASMLALGGALVLGFALYRLWPGRTVTWFAGGGASWSMVRLAVLETAVCIALGVGVLWLFRRTAAAPSRVLGPLADDAFGIYCVHLPLVIAAQLLVAVLPLGPLAKFTLVTAGALAASWIVTRYVLRRSALGRRVF